MNTLQQQVRRARRRLILQRFFDVLGWCWLATLSVALVLVAVDKKWPLGVAVWGWVAGALVVGLAAAIIWTSLRRSTPLEAAIELDHRFSLKERVSSALSLSPADRETEAGEALLADAVAKIERIDVGGRFVVKPPRRLLLPLVPAALAVLVALLIGPAVIDEPMAKAADPNAQQQVKKATAAVRRQLADRREQAKKEGLKDAERLFQKLESGMKELNNEPMKEKAMAKINDLSRQLADRRQQIGGTDKVKEQLDQLKKIDHGPADKLAKALSRGDLKKAADELKKLKDALDNGKLDQKQKNDLAKQIEQMKNQLEKQANACKAAQQNLQKRIAELRKAGQMQQANQLEEQLAKLAAQMPQMQKLQELAQKLGQCSKCLRNGKAGDAAKAMAQMQSDLQGQLKEMEMLDDAEKQLCQAKDQMGCCKCGGAGCAECQGPPGNGLGRGKGIGARPERKTKTAFYDSKVKPKIGKGSAVVVGMTDGPNVKGDVQQEIQAQVESTKHGTTDPLTGRRMPRKHGEHAKEYFDGLRGN
jgi:hypothetical protein